MISQVFILSSKGDHLIYKDCILIIPGVCCVWGGVGGREFLDVHVSQSLQCGTELCVFLRKLY